MRNTFFKASFFSASLLVLAVTAAPAYAEQVTLSCHTAESGVFTFQVDYVTGRIQELGPNGNAYANRIATATVSPNSISWSIDHPTSFRTGDGVTHQTTEHWEGYIDRLAATGRLWIYNGNSANGPMPITCSKVEAKF